MARFLHTNALLLEFSSREGEQMVNSACALLPYVPYRFVSGAYRLSAAASISSLELKWKATDAAR